MLLIFLKCKEPKSFLDSPISGWEKVKRSVLGAARVRQISCHWALTAADRLICRIDYLGSLTLVGGIGSLLLA